jgi:serine protease AprX
VGALDTKGTPADHSDDGVAAFSSRGLSIDGEVKPDVVAPGVRVMSVNAPGSMFELHRAENLSKARTALEGSPEEVRGLARELIEAGRLDPIATKLSDEKMRKVVVRRFDVAPCEGQNGDHPAYISQDGSSMASPFVSGVIANMLEANPSLTPAQIKEILISTAEPVSGADPQAQGHGAVQAQKAVAVAYRLGTP